jgi:ferric-dicitrate binding protein FerR (iron transport regulator)
VTPLEHALVALGRELELPPAPDLVPAVRARLESRRSRRPLVLALAAAALLALAAALAVVFVAWHHLQACGKTSLGAAQSFVGAYRYQSSNPAAYKGDAPEKGAAI